MICGVGVAPCCRRLSSTATAVQMVPLIPQRPSRAPQSGPGVGGSQQITEAGLNTMERAAGRRLCRWSAADVRLTLRRSVHGQWDIRVSGQLESLLTDT